MCACVGECVCVCVDAIAHANLPTRLCCIDSRAHIPPDRSTIPTYYLLAARGDRPPNSIGGARFLYFCP